MRTQELIRHKSCLSGATLGAIDKQSCTVGRHGLFNYRYFPRERAEQLLHRAVCDQKGDDDPPRAISKSFARRGRPSQRRRAMPLMKAAAASRVIVEGANDDAPLRGEFRLPEADYVFLQRASHRHRQCAYGSYGL